MVSNPKRMRYVSENEFTSSEGEGEGFDDGDYSPESRKSSRKSKSGKWLSKNAILARENRLKKKLYLSNLEKQVGHLKTENESFSKVVENQSLLISDLKKEIKYLKSVIANSADIGNLMKSIHRSTGMSVTTSLDQSLSMNFSKPKQVIARKTAHPWEEKQYPSYPTPESDLFSNNSDRLDLDDDLLKDVELSEFLEGCDSLVEPANLEVCESNPLKEHNYTTVDDEGDVGVCLHVSKHRVSLEFCPTCSENASHSWNN